MRDSEIVYRQQKLDERQSQISDSSTRKSFDVENVRLCF